MKKLQYPLVTLVLFSMLYLGYTTQGDPVSDFAPSTLELGNGNNISPDTTPPGNWPYPTDFNWNFSAIPGVNGGSVGAFWFDGKYYLNRWNSSVLYRYNDNGPGGGPGTLADSNTNYAGQIRDMTTDGNFLYGGRATNVLYRMDAAGNLVNTKAVPGASFRAIAWDPNRGGFWNCNFAGNIICHDTNGVVRGTIVTAIGGKYGVAFDSTTSADSAFLWVWSQGTTTTADLTKFYLGNGQVVATYVFTLPGVSIGIAGCANTVQKGNKFMMLLNWQNFAVTGYTLKESGPPPGVCGFAYTAQTSGTSSTLYSVSAVNDMVGWAAGVGATVRRTTDGGVTWTNGNSTPGTISGDIYNIYAVDASTAFVTTSPSATFIYKTSNGGTTWTQVYTLPGGFINAIQMISPTVGYAEGDPVGGKWTILTTVDGGNTWSRMATEPVQVGAEAGWNNSFQVLGTNIWFGTNSTRVYRSTDLGLTWTSGATTGTLNTYGVHYNTPLIGVAGGDAGVKSTDGGVTYSATPVPGAGNISGVSGGSDNFWVCRGSSIYRSSDNGATWMPSSVYTGTGTLWDMDTKISTGCPTGWAVGATGQIVKITGSLVGIINTGIETPSSFLLSQNYPNPFNPVTKINFSLPINEFVTMKVYDISGKEVATLVNQSLSIGSYTVEFNASTLASGAYFYTIQAGEYREVKKMMLLK